MNPEKLKSSDISILHLEIGASALQARTFAELDSLRMEVFQAASIHSLLSTKPALLITAPKPADAEFALQTIRESESYWSLPIFLTMPSSELAESLSDGVADTYEGLRHSIGVIESRLKELPTAQLACASPEFKLCAFLYSRSERTLLPLQSTQHRTLWDYPLVSAFCASSPEASQHIISELELRNLLTPVRLVDRVKDCAQCDSALLSFIDTCPDCHSIDIESSQFFHCFTCGHVAPESKFVRRDSLQCPQCEAKFKHIGVDYDRPLEENVCRTCSAAFIDGDVIARCLSCNAVNNPAQLRSRKVHEYTLSSRAPYAVRHGELQTIAELVDKSQFASPAYFNQMVDWLLSLSKRYESESFSLLKLSVNAPAAEYIAANAQQNDVFFRRMAELTRETDLVHRVGSHEIWILLPKSNRQGRTDFEGQARKLAEKLRSDQGGEDVNFFGISIPEDVPNEYTMQSIIEVLQKG